MVLSPSIVNAALFQNTVIAIAKCVTCMYVYTYMRKYYADEMHYKLKMLGNAGFLYTIKTICTMYGIWFRAYTLLQFVLLMRSKSWTFP